MKVLALDLGSRVGWCVMDTSGMHDYGHETLEGDEGERYALFRQWLGARLDALGSPGFIAFEDVRFHRGKSYIPGERAILMATCVERAVPYVGVDVPELKKYATGKGNAGKPAMVRAAETMVGEDLTDDEADAVLVARWALENAVKEAA